MLFDLDDTLYLQEEWLSGAWVTVAEAAHALYHTDPGEVGSALRHIASSGTDRGRIIDRAMAKIGRPEVDTGPLVEAFRGHHSDTLTLDPETGALLDRLGAVLPIGLITDGDPTIQHGKLTSLGLTRVFDTIVCSDELGRQYRKPHPLSFLVAARQLGVSPSRVAFVGDRPEKDIAGAAAVGMTTIRVRTGEYADRPDDPAPWRSVADAKAAIRMLLDLNEGMPGA
ncbi:MAG: HAD family hydrolase [Actinomycetia bacterium]|nr:HAD family hydrolase [Actinomycetes bacterium]MCP4225801.1 HAD family hydrolase [Actinomycetes bacterium]MCP5033342.1 HAD family hydrolase [Actinomycetes bacterium]